MIKTRNYHNITGLFIVNLIIQVLFVRIYASYKDSNDPLKVWQLKGYGILYFVVPFTGWNTEYKTIFGSLKLSRIIFK